MKPVSILIALVTLGAALSAVSWLVQSDTESEASPTEQTATTATQAPENPFELTTEGPQPKAVLDNGMHEFGSMEFGQTESHNFVIHNEGEVPLKLRMGEVQCKCTVAELERDKVLPGESVEITMSWTPTEMADEFHKKADVWTNDPNNKKLELHVKGAVEQLAIIKPNGDWPLNRITESESQKFTGGIMSRHLDEFEILDYETSTDLLTVEFEPMTEDELETNDVKCGYKIHGTLKGEMPIGRFTATLTLLTDMNGGRDFNIDIVGTRLGPFSIIGERWMGGEMLLMMGDVNSQEGKSVRLSVFVSREDEPVEFEVESTDPPFLELTFEKDETFQVPSREKYWMTFTVPPDSPVGSWTGNDDGSIVVTTNRENVQQFEMYVNFTVHE